MNIADTVKNNKILKKFDQVFNGIDVKYDKDYMKIKFNTDDDIPLNKQLYFPTITVTITCAFEKNCVYYPQVYLDDCLYQV